MEQTAVEKKFGKYVMASMITMFLQSAYSMIDGLFVSNLIGDTALSAVNVAWTVIAVVTAIGTGVGCSGAVMMSTKQGEGKNEESNICTGKCHSCIIGIKYCGYDSFSCFTDTLTETDGRGRRTFKVIADLWKGNAHRRRASDLILWTDTSSSK